MNILIVFGYLRNLVDILMMILKLLYLFEEELLFNFCPIKQFRKFFLQDMMTRFFFLHLRSILHNNLVVIIVRIHNF